MGVSWWWILIIIVILSLLHGHGRSAFEEKRSKGFVGLILAGVGAVAVAIGYAIPETIAHVLGRCPSSSLSASSCLASSSRHAGGRHPNFSKKNFFH